MLSAASNFPDRALTFGPFRLYRNRKQLLEDDRPVRLGGRALDLLIALVERAGEVVSREELEACVWPRAVVEETSLRAHVSALRRALGEGRGGARYITNIPGRGYCFVAPVALLPESSAGPASAGRRPLHNLPVRLTQTVGRADVVETMGELLRRRRLVTVAGPGGMGKTTVALAVAEEALPVYEHGVWFVDLAPVADPRLLAGTVAAALEVGEVASPSGGLLGVAVGARRMLVILDNCEHLVDAAAELVNSLLRTAPGVSILTTSREPLNVEGEWVYRLASLDSPPASALLTAAQALAFPAAQLFVQRAMANSDRFELVDEDVPALVDICQRLDGVPLAIELAAARVDGLGLQELAHRLEHPLQLLTRGRRTAPPRHKTLRALLDWSFELLTPNEQAVLCRLSVFKGSFTLDAASAVAVEGSLHAGEVIECVLGLAVKSLVTADASGDVIRYRLPAATHAYAGERLQAIGPGRPVLHRHALCVLELCRRSMADAQRMARAEWLAAYARIIDDVRAALDWSFGAEGDAGLGVELAAAVQPLVKELGFEEEYIERSRQALEQIHLLSPPQPALELRLNSTLCFYNGLAPPRGRLGPAVFQRTQELADELGDAEHQITAAYGAWVGAYGVGDYPSARAAAERIDRIARAHADPASILLADRLTAQVQHYLGNQALARRLGERVLRHPPIELPAAHATLVPHSVSMPILLGRVLWLEGKPDQAREMARMAVQRAADQHPLAMTQALCMLACPLALWRGDDDAGLLVAQLGAASTRHFQAYFQTWAEIYAAVLRGREEAAGAGEAAVIAALTPALVANCHPKQLDSAGTLAEHLVDAGTLARAEAGIVGWCAPEILRARAVQLLRADPEGEASAAESLYLRALEMARRQSALAWELRIANSLGRLWQGQRRARDATVLVQGVYERFSEGFETADLAAARALLADLARALPD